MLLGTEVGLDPGDTVLDGDPAAVLRTPLCARHDAQPIFARLVQATVRPMLRDRRPVCLFCL